MSNNDGPAQVYQNETTGHWLSLRLTGRKNNRDAAGARVALLRQDQQTQWQRVARDGSYAASNDPRVHFGLGQEGGPAAVGVVWPDGTREIWRGVTIDRFVDLVEGEGEPWR